LCGSHDGWRFYTNKKKKKKGGIDQVNKLAFIYPAAALRPNSGGVAFAI
jgi:hypothetical protein